MEVSRQQQVEGEIPIPINNSNNNNYGGANGHHGNMIHHHAHHHHHHDPVPPLPVPHSNTNNNIISSSSPVLLSAAAVMNGQVEDDYNKKVASVVVVRYRECLKNHAASMGGNATDGCGEFMPSGEEGTIEALNCSACHCHRNFHRKEIEGEEEHHHHPADYYFQRLHHQGTTRKFLLPPPPAAAAGGGGGSILPSRSVPPHHHHMIMPFNYNIPSLPSESDEQEVGDHIHGTGSRAAPTHHVQQLVKKRFRTKFTPEQKEKMLAFADKVGWKLQKQEESVVQHFCQEIGVKRRVLKVWMHNNKHNLAKNLTHLPLPPTTTTT